MAKQHDETLVFSWRRSPGTQQGWHKAGQGDTKAKEDQALSEPAPTETCPKPLQNCSPGAASGGG